MKPSSVSSTFVTDKIADCRAFYETYFDGKISFDCGWYVIVKIGGDKNGPEIGFMEPRDGAAPYTGGSMLNITYSDVDKVHEILTNAGVVPAVQLEDHPWGDRGFGVIDPLGTMVYCLTPIETSDEFKSFKKEIM